MNGLMEFLKINKDKRLIHIKLNEEGYFNASYLAKGLVFDGAVPQIEAINYTVRLLNLRHLETILNELSNISIPLTGGHIGYHFSKENRHIEIFRELPQLLSSCLEKPQKSIEAWKNELIRREVSNRNILETEDLFLKDSNYLAVVEDPNGVLYLSSKSPGQNRTEIYDTLKRLTRNHGFNKSYMSKEQRERYLLISNS